MSAKLPWRETYRRMPWGAIVKITGVVTVIASAASAVILTALATSAVRDEQQREYELEHPRWTDKNRWPHGE